MAGLALPELCLVVAPAGGCAELSDFFEQMFLKASGSPHISSPLKKLGVLKTSYVEH